MGLCYPNTPHYSSSRPWGMKCDRLCKEIFSMCVVFLSIIVNFRVTFSVEKNTWLGDEECNSPAGGGGGDSYMEQTGMLIGNFEFNP
mgnify:CR=1 FL=1